MPETMNSPMIIGKIETPRQFSQLGLIAADGSGSMTERAVGNITKAQATNKAMRELFTRFKVSRVARNFAFGLVTFDDQATVRMPPTQVGPDLDDNGNYDPLVGHGGGTRIYNALEEGARMIDDFLAKAPAEGVPHSAVLLLLSDGCCSDPDRTRQVADRIKNGPNGSRIKICTALFATIGNTDAAGEALLREIASDPVMGYKTVYDGETLRGFFERSISAASGGIQII
jgi:uncharacterized protein YegL